MKIKAKGGAKRSYRPWERKTLEEIWGKATKILIGALTDRIERERVWKLFKKVFEHVRIKCFKKTLYMIFNWLKLGSIYWKGFDWSSVNWASIKTDRGWPKFLITISIDRKIGSIDRNFGKTNFWKIKANFVQKLLKALNFMNKCMSMRWNVFQKHKFWT